MSTSFDILPGSKVIPSFGEIIELSTERLHQFLKDIGVSARPRISVCLRSKEQVKTIDFQTPAKWDQNWYAWFSVPPIQGGTDVQLMTIDEDEKDMWLEELMLNRRVEAQRAFLKSCSEYGYYWVLSRTMGQSATINLSYGLIAGSITELTKGLIYSSDGAWEYERFPAIAEEFNSWYFRPQLANDPAYKGFAER